MMPADEIQRGTVVPDWLRAAVQRAINYGSLPKRGASVRSAGDVFAHYLAGRTWVNRPGTMMAEDGSTLFVSEPRQPATEELERDVREFAKAISCDWAIEPQGSGIRIILKERTPNR